MQIIAQTTRAVGHELLTHCACRGIQSGSLHIGDTGKALAHFSAPKVSPRTRYRWAASAPIQTGRTTTVPAAMMLFHSTLTGLTNSVNPTGAVRVPAPVRTLAKRNSFQANIKAESPVAIIPGIVSGTVMRRKVPSGLLPSTWAAS